MSVSTYEVEKPDGTSFKPVEVQGTSIHPALLVCAKLRRQGLKTSTEGRDVLVNDREIEGTYRVRRNGKEIAGIHVQYGI